MFTYCYGQFGTMKKHPISSAMTSKTRSSRQEIVNVIARVIQESLAGLGFCKVRKCSSMERFHPRVQWPYWFTTTRRRLLHKI